MAVIAQRCGGQETLGKSKGKDKLNNVGSSNWHAGWLEGEPQSYREQDENMLMGGGRRQIGKQDQIQDVG